MKLATDVFVIGGGPAGLTAAIAARRKGFQVTVADGAAPGADKACGEGILPEGLEELRRLGIDVLHSAGRPFCGVRFLEPGVCAQASFSHRSGLGIRRTALHALLAERAAACGVRLLWKTQVVGIAADGVALRNGFARAHWIIGADGGQSRVRAWIGLEPRAPFARRYGLRRHFLVQPWSDFVEVYWGQDAQLYVSQMSREEVCVVLISLHPALNMEAALQNFPEAAARLAAAVPAGAGRGALTATLRLPHVYRGKVALIGDASGSVDAITGQGLSLAFLQAEALAAALAAGNLESYQAAHRRIMRRPAAISRLLLALAGRPRLRKRLLRTLAREPQLFERLLAMLAGVASATESALCGLRLGWRLVAS